MALNRRTKIVLVGGAVATLVVVLLVVFWPREEDAAVLWARVQAQERAAIQRRSALEVRWQLARLKAAKKLGFVVGETFKAHGLSWQTSRVFGGGVFWHLYVEVICTGPISETALRNFLEDRKVPAKKLTEVFSKVCIRVYHSPEYEAAGFQLAYLLANDGDWPVKIHTHPAILRGLSAPKTLRFGLTHEQRQQFYAQVCQAEGAISKQINAKEIRKKLPGLDDEERRLLLADQMKREDIARERAFARIAKSWGLDAKQAHAIYREGMDNGWLGR